MTFLALALLVHGNQGFVRAMVSPHETSGDTVLAVAGCPCVCGPACDVMSLCERTKQLAHSLSQSARRRSSRGFTRACLGVLASLKLNRWCTARVIREWGLMCMCARCYQSQCSVHPSVACVHDTQHTLTPSTQTDNQSTQYEEKAALLTEVRCQQMSVGLLCAVLGEKCTRFRRPQWKCLAF